MLPVRAEDSEDQRYHENLALVRERILGFALRRLVPQRADFAQAEDIAQSCVIALWERYPEKRELAEMLRIAVGAARHKIAQFYRDRNRMPDGFDTEGELHAQNPHSGERMLARIAAREDTDRFLAAMLKLPAQCRELMRLKLVEQRSYAEIRLLTGISGNIYEMARRCFQTLLRHAGGRFS